MPAYRCAASALMITTLAACSSLSGSPQSSIQPPEGGLGGLTFGEARTADQPVTVQLRLNNPNAFDLVLDRLTFDLAVNGQAFTEGQSEDTITIPSLDEILVPIDLTMDVNVLADRVTALGVGKRLDYQLRGEAHVSGWFAPSLPFRRDGKLALPKLPETDDDTAGG